MVDLGSFAIIQDEMQVAAVNGPMEAALMDAHHYAAVYGQDGPVKLVGRNKASRAALRAIADHEEGEGRDRPPRPSIQEAFFAGFSYAATSPDDEQGPRWWRDAAWSDYQEATKALANPVKGGGGGDG